LSAVDSGTEQKIASHFSNALRDVTIVMVSHRLHSHLAFDKVIVLENGEIIEMGSPEMLIERGGAFKQMADYQRKQ
jgi:ATP-binding cassette subfamily B protein